jgi:catechol 2,3-dioxygenase-like lactoylglutathione lyase family enzyme
MGVNLSWRCGSCRSSLFLAMTLIGVCSSYARPHHADSAPQASSQPILLHTCLITDNVTSLVAFYEPVLQQKARWSGGDYAEFATGVGVLAVFASSAQEKYIPRSAEGAKNRSAILEFKVADVDAEYRRLQGLVKTWVKGPTTQPWGTRSIYFRDPDGNLVDFYSVAPAA